MQDDTSYVSTCTTKLAQADMQPTPEKQTEQGRGEFATAPSLSEPEKKFRTLRYGEGEGRTEYTVSNQHNGYALERGHVLRLSLIHI